MYRRDNQHPSVIVVLALLLTLTLAVLGPLNKAAKAQSQSEPQSNVVWTVDGASPYGTIVLPVTRAWTTAASAGTLDEDSLSNTQVNNFILTLKPGTTGMIRARYSITAVDGMNPFCPATQSIIRIRYRDSDGTTTGARVLVEIRRTNVLTGGNTLVLAFDSNILPGAGTSFTTVTGTGPFDFDFLQNVYWIEATISRTNSAQFADLGSIQLSESMGAVCP